MKLLAIDTATEACSAALVIDGDLRSRYAVEPRGHSRLLLPMLDELLAEAGISAAQLDGLAFGRGPGSFVGLRIGAGMAQGIAFARGLPVAPVSTLATIARRRWRDAGRGRCRVLVAIDARMGEVYWGAFEVGDDGQPRALLDECVSPPQAVPLPPRDGRPGDGWLAAGTGWGSYAEVLAARCDAVCAEWDGELLPHAEDLLAMGEAMLARGEGVDAALAQPVYLRDRVAEKSPRR